MLVTGIDKNELNAEMLRNGYNDTTLADEMGISRSSFWKKKNGHSEFKHGELRMIKRKLKLSDALFKKIFF